MVLAQRTLILITRRTASLALAVRILLLDWGCISEVSTRKPAVARL
jgi:ABC-type bacteriocin/lantibiotic exporter with double-glycine peptidase domain